MHGLPFILLMSDKQVTAAWRGLRVRSLSGDIRGRWALADSCGHKRPDREDLVMPQVGRHTRRRLRI